MDTHHLQHETFDAFIARVWPDGVPQDCEFLDAEELDCIEQGRLEERYCSSCRSYASLAERYDRSHV